jgi:hypothetical protein
MRDLSELAAQALANAKAAAPIQRGGPPATLTATVVEERDGETTVVWRSTPAEAADA